MLVPTGGAEHTLPPSAPERGDSSRGTSYRGCTGVTGGEEDARCVLWKNRHRDTVLPGESPTAHPGCAVSGGCSHTRSPQPQSIPSSGAHPSTGASPAHGTAAQSIPGPPATAPPEHPRPPWQSSCGRSRPVNPVRSRLTRTLRPAAAAVSLAHACRRSEPGRFSRAGRRRGGGCVWGPSVLHRAHSHHARRDAGCISLPALRSAEAAVTSETVPWQSPARTAPLRFSCTGALRALGKPIFVPGPRGLRERPDAGGKPGPGSALLAMGTRGSPKTTHKHPDGQRGPGDGCPGKGHRHAGRPHPDPSPRTSPELRQRSQNMTRFFH